MSTANRCDLLFVYGTLRRESPHPMAHLLAARGRWVAVGSIGGRLFDLGSYPGWVASSPLDTERVRGDLFSVGLDPKLLAELDEYEGVNAPSPEYERIRAVVTCGGGISHEAWVYRYLLPVAHLHPIPGGDYLAYLAGER